MERRTKISGSFALSLETDLSENEIKSIVQSNLSKLFPNSSLSHLSIKIKQSDKLLGKLDIEETFKTIEAFLTNPNSKPEEEKFHKIPLVYNNEEYKVRVMPRKFYVFRRNLSCVCCGIKANTLMLELGKKNNSHLNLYAESNEELILMTLDHVHPKSKGGNNDMSNLQTMCTQCNTLKSHSNISLDKLRRLRKIYDKYYKKIGRKKFALLAKNFIKKYSIKNHFKQDLLYLKNHLFVINIDNDPKAVKLIYCDKHNIEPLFCIPKNIPLNPIEITDSHLIIDLNGYRIRIAKTHIKNNKKFFPEPSKEEKK